MVRPAGSAAMNWTTEKPTVAGWYWYREDGKNVWVVWVDDELTIWLHGDQRAYALDDGGMQEFLGPITPTTYDAGRRAGLEDAADIAFDHTCNDPRFCSCSSEIYKQLAQQAAQDGKGER